MPSSGCSQRNVRSRKESLFKYQRRRMSSDHQVFISRNDPHAAFATGCANRVFVRVVGSRIDRESEIREPVANFRTNSGGMLADSAGEDQHIQSAERGR